MSGSSSFDAGELSKETYTKPSGAIRWGSSLFWAPANPHHGTASGAPHGGICATPMSALEGSDVCTE
jgi:hypothetical protein